AVCDEFWMVGRGAVGPFDGDLDDYQRYLLDESKRLREEAKRDELQASSSPATTPPPALAPVAAPVVAAAPTPISAVDQKEQRRLAALARQELADSIRPFKKELEA